MNFESLRYVHLFLCDRVYGGPEEGGWYYEAGEPIMHTANRVFEDAQEAANYRAQLSQTVEKELNEDMPAIDSVLSQGQYRFQVGLPGELPASYPVERPRYE